MAQDTKRRSFKDFVSDQKHEQRMKACAICRLPKEVMEQFRDMRAKRIPAPMFCLWVKTEYGIRITPEDLQAHGVGRHSVRNATR